MTEELKQFILNNAYLINKDTKESWEKIYEKLRLIEIGEFTQMILDARINDPAMIMGYIPRRYLFYSKIENYRIPNSVTSIGSDAFRGCSKLTSIVIPDSVTSIGDQAFFNCSSLTSVVIPDSVTSIGYEVFDFCSSLTEIQFKGTIKEAIKLGIGNKAKKEWRQGSPIQRIICTDGEINLQYGIRLFS